MRFSAMGTHVEVHGDPVIAIRRCFEEAERIFSRFRVDSELSRLNRAEGPLRVSPALFSALASARWWHASTGGVFDPGVGRTMLALGYDRSFSPGALDDPRLAADTTRGSIAEVELDERTWTVRRPAHVLLDLGGIAKGRTVDHAVAPFRGSTVLSVDAGGDAALLGDDWLVDVEDPRDVDRVLLTLKVRDRSVATSAGNRRTWLRGSARMHHLVDPRTGRPATTDLVQVTAVAPTTEAADVLAKTAFLLGARAATSFLERLPQVGAVFVHDDGRVSVMGDVEVSDDRAA